MKLLLLGAAALAANQDAPPPPRLVTDATRADPARLVALETPGVVFFHDDFESSASLAKYFEVRGKDAGLAVVVADPKLAHGGRGALQLTSPARDGRSSGAGVSGWFGDAPRERVHLRYWLKWAEDYDQGNLNHTGGCLVGAAGDDKWAGMGTAGQKPRGDDHFSTSFETWVDWRRVAPPGHAFLYTYWLDMERDKDGHFWGNMLVPAQAERVLPERGRWYCFEVMVRRNRPNEFDGELATWIDGKLYMHWTGLRLCSSADVLLKRFGLDVYVHQAHKDNRVWFDDVALSTGYIGTADAAPQPARDEKPK